MSRKGFTIIDLVIVFVYWAIIGFILFFLILTPIADFLDLLGLGEVVSKIGLSSCLGNIIISIFGYPFTLFMLWLLKPVGRVIAPITHARTYANIKKVLPLSVSISFFLFLGMNNCGIWDILGVEGFMRTIYSVVIFLCLGFLSAISTMG